MLVLSRKLGEKVIIGNDITLTVLEVIGNRVRVGIDAPANVRILRGELTSSPYLPAPAAINHSPLSEDVALPLFRLAT